MNTIEYRLEFATKAEAENALDYYENQPGYQGGWVTLPRTGKPAWQLHISFTADKIKLLADGSLLSALGVVHADRVKAHAG